jgi:hypothetical protein
VVIELQRGPSTRRRELPSALTIQIAKQEGGISPPRFGQPVERSYATRVLSGDQWGSPGTPTPSAGVSSRAALPSA